MSDAIDTAARAERLLRLLECSSDGICELDRDGRCTYVNVPGARLLGFQPVEMVGAPLHELIHSGGARVDPTQCTLCQAIATAKELNPAEGAGREQGVLKHKDGREIPVSYKAARIVVDGMWQSSVLSFCDDSQIRRLEVAFGDRSAELADLERRKTEFIATLAHEVRNPLAPLRAALQVMRKASANAGSMEELRALMERQLEHLVRLVNDLLDIARVGSGQMTLAKEHVTLQEVLNCAVEASEPLRERNHSLALDIPIEPVYLDADPARLVQVFTNILNNAAQFSAPGGSISLRVERAEHEVRIDIADSGVGIAREALTRIFDMFTRVGRDKTHAHPGLGIGLNLARRLVELHGGRLTASSEGLGKGSHFLTTLPVSASVQAPTTPDPVPAGNETVAPIRALIVDDNVDAAVTLSLLLQLGGHSTALAHDGAEALNSLSSFKPDIILLDLGLPDMDGFEIAQRIRSMRDLRQPLLVAVTGWGGAEDRERTKQAGFDEHLTKPVDIAVIELILTRLSQRPLPDERGSATATRAHMLGAPP